MGQPPRRQGSTSSTKTVSHSCCLLRSPKVRPAPGNSTLNATLQPGAEFIVESQATTTIAGLGSAQLFTDGAVTGFLIFRFVPTGQEASVPLQTGNAGSYVLSFDASAPGFNTGIAVANVAASTAAIPVVFRDDAGNVLASDTITLNPQGHLSFVVTTNYPSTVGKRGRLCSKHLQAVRSVLSRSEP